MHDNYELYSFSPASVHKLEPNRGPSIPLLDPNSSRLSHAVPVQEDHTYIPHSVTDNYGSNSFSPVQKLLPNRGPPTTSTPLLDPQQSQVAPNPWHEGSHQTSKYKRQVTSQLLTVAKLSVLPLLASAYLAFCVIANKRLIPLKTDGFYAFTPDRIATIKAGVTSLSQLVIFAALYPVYDIVSELQSEEFFRIVSTRRMRGVPLTVLDKMSNPNYGAVRFLNDVISRSSSIYLVPAFVAMLISVAISLVTPATLDVASVLVENEVVALAVGAISAQAVYNVSIPVRDILGFVADENSAFAASVLWSEMELGANYSFSVATSDAEFAAYIVPSPVDLPTTVSAHWMTDVIGINPSCTWASTNISAPIQLQENQSLGTNTSGIYLENLDLDIIITDINYGFSMFSISVADPSYLVFNHSTQGPPTDGSTVFVVSQCFTGCDNLTLFDPVVLNLTNIPTFILDVNATADEQAQSWNFAFLACRPNAVIQTREVMSNGTGFLEILPVRNGKRYTPQGNLHPTQTPAMLSFALGSITLYAGPTNISSSSAGSYTSVQADFLFGQKQIDNLPPPLYSGPPWVVTILPTDTLASKFAAMLQSASKPYLAGYLGTAYVPARLFSPKVAFVSSMPFIIASTVMFGILFILMVIMHFRRDGKSFTLVSVAAALHGSNLPNYFARAGKSWALMADGDQRVVLQKGEDGMNVLQIINDSCKTDKGR